MPKCIATEVSGNPLEHTSKALRYGTRSQGRLSITAKTLMFVIVIIIIIKYFVNE